MIDAELERYRRLVTDLGIDCPRPSTATPSEVVALVERFHGGTLPPALVELHDAFVAGQDCFVDGVMLEWPADPQAAFTWSSWTAGTPVAPRHHVPTFSMNELIYTVAVDPERFGQVWRFQVAAEATDVVRVTDDLGQLLDQWSDLIERGVLGPIDGRLGVLSGGGIDWFSAYPDPNLLVMPYPAPDPFLSERQRECGVDRSIYDSGEQARLQDQADGDLQRLEMRWSPGAR